MKRIASSFLLALCLSGVLLSTAWAVESVDTSENSQEAALETEEAPYKNNFSEDGNFATAITDALPVADSAELAMAATSGTCGDNLVWNLANGVLTISGQGPMDDYASYSTTPWSNIRKDILCLKIESGVTSIGEGAFWLCSNITDVVIADTVTSIGTRAFQGCSSIRSVSVPATVNFSAFAISQELTYLKLTGTGDMYNYNGSTAPNWKSSDKSLSVEIEDGVTSVGNYAFYNCTRLSSVTFSDSITSIGHHAFLKCSNLLEIILPPKTKIINESAFNQCSELSTVIFPTGVEEIGERAFFSCTKLTNIDIPNSVVSIGEDAFAVCESFTCITVPNSVTNIGDDAFRLCTGLTNVTMPGTIGCGVFDGCTGITTVRLTGSGPMISYSSTWPPSGPCSWYADTPWHQGSLAGNTVSVEIENGITSIGDYAFYKCSGPIQITLPESIVEIGNGAFCECTGLSDIIIPGDVKRIGRRAFENCINITNIVIPDSVTSICNNAFWRCTGLTSISMPATAEIEPYPFSGCTSIVKVILTGSGPMTDFSSTYSYTPWYTSSVAGTNVSVSVEGTVSSISDKAFYGCHRLTSISISGSVTSIGDYAFSGCTGLTGVLSIPTGVTTVGEYAYQDCSGFSGSLIIPDSIKNIGDYAFKGCTGINGSLIIGNGLETIGSYTFSGCQNFAGGLRIGSKVSEIGKSAFSNFKFSGGLTIPGNIVSIGDSAFYRCSGLTSVTISNGTNSIGNSAFHSCDGLTHVTIPSSVKSIGSSAFYGCSNLMSTTIASGVASIGDSAFYGCSSLVGLTIPNSVSAIGNSAFRACIGLTRITIPANVTVIEGSIFYGCSSLTDVTFRGSVTQVNGSAFSGCNRLTSIIIPDSVTSIGDYAFSGCTGLNSVTIPVKVTNIGKYAFEGCKNISDIYYGGSKNQWNTVSIATGNSALSASTVTIHYAVGDEEGDVSNPGGYLLGFDSTLWSNNTGVVFYYDENGINIDGKTYTYSGRVSFSNLNQNVSIGCHVSYLLDTNGEITSLVVLKRDTGVLTDANRWKFKVNGYTYNDSTHGSDPIQYLNQDVSVYYYSSPDRYAAQIIPLQVEIGTITNANVDLTLHKASLTMGGTTYPVSPGLYAALPESQYGYYMDKNDAVLEIENGEIVKIQLLSDYWSEPSVHVKAGETPTFELNGGIFTPSQQSLEVSFSYGTSNCPTKVRNALRANVENNVTLTNVSVTSASQYIKISLEAGSAQLLRFEDSVSWKFSVSPIVSWTNVGQITERLPLNITAAYSINGTQKSCSWEYSAVVLNNRDLQKMQEEEDRKNSNGAASDAANELEALMGSKKVTIGTTYRPFGLSSNDTKILQENIITQVLLYETPKKTWIEKLEEKIDKKILSKVFGNYSSIMDVGTHVLELDYIIENCKLGVLSHDYGSQRIRIACTMSDFKLMDKSYSGIITLHYRVLGPTDTKRGEYVPAHLSEGTLGGITIIDMQAFADGVYSVAATELKSAYNKALDAVFSLFPKELFSETTQKIFDKVTSKTKDIGWKAVTHAAKSGSVKCPVNIYIYDNEGSLCGSIEDNEVVLLNGPFQLWVEEDFKYFSNVPYDYQIEYVATANGTMTVELTEYIDSSTALRSLSFSVPLYGSVLYTQQSPEQICGDTAQYVISSGTDLVCTVEDESYLLQFDSSDVQMLDLVGQTDGISCDVVLQLSNGGNSDQTATYFIAIYGEDGKLLNLTEDGITMAANAAENRFYQLAANEPIAYAKAFMLDDAYAPLSECTSCQFTLEDAQLFALIDMP